jgi:uracil-DNA glycosylase family 4
MSFVIRVHCKKNNCPLFPCAQIPTEFGHYRPDDAISYINDYASVKKGGDYSKRQCHASTKNGGDYMFSTAIAFIGQGGGADEEKQGRPFIGAAGQRLRRIINDVFELQKFNYCFSNNVRAHPEGNRKPTLKEVRCCKDFLARDLWALNVQMIIALGHSAREATQHRLDFRSMKELKQKVVMSKFDIPMITTIHPSPRNSGSDVENWIKEDILFALQYLEKDTI